MLALTLAWLAALWAAGRYTAHRGETHWTSILLIYAPRTPLLLPPLALALTAASVQQRLVFALNAVLALAVWRSLRGRADGRGAVAAGLPLRVITYNVFGGSRGAERVAELLADASADLILLQEAWWSFAHHPSDARPAIARRLPGWHLAESAGDHELLIVSRHPLLEVRERPLDARRSCLECRVDLGGRPVRVVNVHIVPPATMADLWRHRWRLPEYLEGNARARRAQAEALHALLLEWDGPTIVAGDFNSPPHAYPRRVVPSSFVDAFEQAGRGLGCTFRSSLPMWRLDYVLATWHFRVLAHHTLRAGCSDHCPVVADLVLPG